MQVDEALELADQWIKGVPLHDGVQGWRVACATLAAEVRTLRVEIGTLREQLAEATRQLVSPLVMERGPWTASADGRVLESDDFHHDATLRVGGDFADDEQRKQYADELARRLRKGQQMETKPDSAASALSAGLAGSLPWHLGFSNEIADMLRPTGDWHPDMVRYAVVQVCDHDGRHVCWAKSTEHAAFIVEAVNKTANAQAQATDAASCGWSPGATGSIRGIDKEVMTDAEIQSAERRDQPCS